MFERFRSMYAPTRDSLEAGGAWVNERLTRSEGYVDYAHEFAGASFGGGLYRIHDDRTGPESLRLITAAFPELAQRVCPFGYDWLGRQFAVDSGRVEAGQSQVLLLEPGTGEALEIPASFLSFHDAELVDHADAALATEFFRSWSASAPAALPLRRDQCVGYQIPLFVGGKDTVDNLEVSDLVVYWTTLGQVRLRTLDSPSVNSPDDM